MPAEASTIAPDTTAQHHINEAFDVRVDAPPSLVAYSVTPLMTERLGSVTRMSHVQSGTWRTSFPEWVAFREQLDARWPWVAIEDEFLEADGRGVMGRLVTRSWWVRP